MEELRDKNGLTEAEFLAGYDMTKFDRPSLTADNLIFSFENGVSLLLIRRKGHPYLGRWALPGGFAEKGESIEESAARELKEETSLTGLEVVPAGFFAYPGRDPRGWVATRSFIADVSGHESEVMADDDAADARFFRLKAARNEEKVCLTLQNGEDTLKAEASVMLKKGLTGRTWEISHLSSDGLAFDHGKIIIDALLRLEDGGKFGFDRL